MILKYVENIIRKNGKNNIPKKSKKLYNKDRFIYELIDFKIKL